jgi:hypothetical protein
MHAYEGFKLLKSRLSMNHGIDETLFWRNLFNIQPDALYGEMAMGILAQNIH